MGTNYHIQFETCKYCGLHRSEYHIGKSSGGWCFSLHVDPGNGIHDLDDVVSLCKLGKIVDEYKDVLSIKELLNIIKNQSWKPIRKYSDKYYKNEEDFLRINHAIKGPNNLMRHKIDGIHCIGHGNGTWDLVIGEFS